LLNSDAVGRSANSPRVLGVGEHSGIEASSYLHSLV
jgi:hypothetical protein